MEIVTYIKNVKISPKKLRFMLDDVKKMKPAQALSVLKYTPKKGAKIFYKAINSAISNAKNALKVEDNLLKFKVFTIEEGHKIKRWRAGSRGTANQFRRRYAHIKIILEAEKKAVVAKKEIKPLKVGTTEVKSTRPKAHKRRNNVIARSVATKQSR